MSLQQLHYYYEHLRPCITPCYFDLAFLRLVSFHLSSSCRFLCFTSEPNMHSCRLNTVCRAVSYSGLLLLLSLPCVEKQVLTKFFSIDTSSAVHFRSSLHISHDCFSATFSLYAYYHNSLLQQLRAVRWVCLIQSPSRGLPSSLMCLSQHTDTTEPDPHSLSPWRCSHPVKGCGCPALLQSNSFCNPRHAYCLPMPVVPQREDFVMRSSHDYFLIIP